MPFLSPETKVKKLKIQTAKTQRKHKEEQKISLLEVLYVFTSLRLCVFAVDVFWMWS